MVFIFQCANIVYHIDLFVYIEESLHPWNKPDLKMVHELFFFFLVLQFYFILFLTLGGHLFFNLNLFILIGG